MFSLAGPFGASAAITFLGAFLIAHFANVSPAIFFAGVGIFALIFGVLDLIVWLKPKPTNTPVPDFGPLTPIMNNFAIVTVLGLTLGYLAGTYI